MSKLTLRMTRLPCAANLIISLVTDTKLLPPVINKNRSLSYQRQRLNTRAEVIRETPVRCTAMAVALRCTSTVHRLNVRAVRASRLRSRDRMK
eukprot:4017188-Pleurochrysis_carterae.AAC.1